MKKRMAALVALLMALCLIAPAALAEPELNWSDAEATAAQLDPDGQFFQVADYDLMLWVPSTFTEKELSQEDIDDGYVSLLTDANEEKAIYIMRNTEKEVDLETMKEAFSEGGYTDVEIGVINGIRALCFTDTENDAFSIAYIFTDSPGYLQFIFYPISDEEFQSVAACVSASIQAMQ